MFDANSSNEILIGVREVGATYRLEERSEAQAAPAACEVFDEAAFEVIADLLGPAKTLSTLQKLVIELETRFVSADHGAESRERFARDAHVVTSIAGTIGFADLSRRCTKLLALQLDDASFEAAASAIVEAKAVASRRLLALIIERGARVHVA